MTYPPKWSRRDFGIQAICDNSKLCLILTLASKKGSSSILVLKTDEEPKLDANKWTVNNSNVNQHEK